MTSAGFGFEQVCSQIFLGSNWLPTRCVPTDCSSCFLVLDWVPTVSCFNRVVHRGFGFSIVFGLVMFIVFLDSRLDCLSIVFLVQGVPSYFLVLLSSRRRRRDLGQDKFVHRMCWVGFQQVCSSCQVGFRQVWVPISLFIEFLSSDWLSIGFFICSDGFLHLFVFLVSH